MKITDKLFPAHFGSTDRRGIIIALLVSALSLVLLITIKPRVENKTKLSIARIDNISNDVRLKGASSVSFFDVSKNEELQNNDEIFTGENSTASVAFLNSKTKLKIPSSSLIKIEVAKEGETIEVKQGVVELVLAKNETINLKVDGVSQQITTTQAESTVKVSLNAGELHLSTKDSGVKIKSKKKESVLKPNEEMLIAKKPVIKSPVVEKIDFLVSSPVSSENIEEGTGIKIITNQKSNYNILLSGNSDFGQPLYSSTFEGSSYIWDISPEEGSYFLKIESRENSKIVPITIVSKFKVEGYKPADGELLTLRQGELITLHWNPLPVKSYKIAVRDSKGNEKTHISKTNELQLENIKGKFLEWQVAPEISDNKYSKMQKVNHVELKFSGKIEFINIDDKNKLKVSDMPAKFAWKAPEGQLFQVKLKDLKNVKVILSKKTKESKIDLPVNTIGNYQVEVSSLDYPKQKKAEFKFDVVAPFSSIPQASDIHLSRSIHDGVDAYKISVPTIPEASKYRFEIYKDNVGKALVYTEESATPEFFWISNRTEVYYLRYKVYDLENRESDFSPFSKLIFPIAPLSDW